MVVARSASALERWVLGVYGLVMREGWVENFKCVMAVRSGLVVNDSQVSNVEQEGEDELRKKRGKKKKKLGQCVIWAVGAARSRLAGAWLGGGVCSLPLSLFVCEC